jgi:hypothetical protein
MKGTTGPKLAQTSTSKTMGSLSGSSVSNKHGSIKETKLPNGGCQRNQKKK